LCLATITDNRALISSVSSVVALFLPRAGFIFSGTFVDGGHSDVADGRGERDA
jgi:hypothetical protein